jgi:hypothetical protein
MNLIWLGLIMQFHLTSSWSDSYGLHSMPHLRLLAADWQHKVTPAATRLLAGKGATTARQAPVAVAHVSRNFYLPRPNSPVHVARLSAGFSSDADGEIVEFLWRVDGSSYRGAEIDIVSFHEPAAQTRVQVQLTVRDNDGQSSTLNTELVIANISVVSDRSPP